MKTIHVDLRAVVDGKYVFRKKYTGRTIIFAYLVCLATFTQIM
jgi:hypothetical protein